jgi:hypothetical protein
LRPDILTLGFDYRSFLLLTCRFGLFKSFCVASVKSILRS